MRLSELHTGERGVIVKVTGHGGFRKRIVEMGFIKGQIVEVLLDAPLQDPVKYKVMGYEVSLRRSEAEMIEVMSENEAKLLEDYDINKNNNYQNTTESADNALSNSYAADSEVLKKYHTINVVLVGNPNCGKTSLFNFASGAHERVGNYSGVTVDAKVGHADFGGYHFNIVDLPGTYSLSAYSPEELYVRRQIVNHTPDIVINVIDTSNIERNLYLTTQLIDMHLRIVCALNMFDETEQRGDKVDVEKLSELLGIPMIPTVFKSGRGVNELFQAIIDIYEGAEDLDPHFRHIHINHGHEIEHGITEIQEHLKQEKDLRHRYSTRFLAIKLLENDKEVEDYIKGMPDAAEILRHRDKAAQRVKEETGEDSETAIMDSKYGFIRGALEESGYRTGQDKDIYKITHLLDNIFTDKWLGLPIFMLILVAMFTSTFVIGQYPMEWIDNCVVWLGRAVGSILPIGPVRAMLTEGIIGGVGAVIVFLPQILILYFFISFMEDSGYMARAAFITDRLMHKMGLHGKSFIPLIMGFGCNVPAIMATRTIESRRSRLVTMLILPLISCEARIPVYIMIIGTFFSVRYQSLIMMSLYLIGVLTAVIISKILTKYILIGEDTPFVMELPPYRFPTWKAVSRHTWEKGKQYLKKMGGVILVASIIVWALGYFPHNDSLSQMQQKEHSYIGTIGKTVEPIFTPQGFNWKLDVGLISGVGAKEIIASTLGVLYTDDESFENNNKPENNKATKYARMRQLMSDDGITPLSAVSFLLFVLFYFPCIATISAIKSETGRWRMALFAAGYTTILAWIISALVYQIGSLII
jgi:ferrous iron transport protein B